MKRLGMILIVLGMAWSGPGAILAQGGEDACPAIVETALALTDESCSGTGRNQACYGHVRVEAEPQADAADFVFERAGDVVDLAALQGLRTAAMDVEAETWGVALLRLQANLPDTLPGQNVTLLLFGDAQVAPGQPQPPTVSVAPASGTVNVRRGPSTQDLVLGQLAAGESAVADGRLADSTWLRIRWEDGPAWVFAELVRAEGDTAALDVIDPDAAPVVYGPMQAFYLTTGLGDAPCAAAPESGLLVQTPQGVGEVTLLINEVVMRFASTGWLQAQAGGQMRVCTAEGGVRLAARTGAGFALAGTCVSVPLDENLAPSGPPGAPEPFDAAALPLPLAGGLGQTLAPVSAAPPLSEDAIAQLAVVPRSGTWTAAFGEAELSCPTGFGGPVDLSSSNGPRVIAFAADGGAAVLTVPGWDQSVAFARTAPDVYSGLAVYEDGTTEAITWQIAAADQIEGLSVITFPDACVINAPFTLNLAGE